MLDVVTIEPGSIKDRANDILDFVADKTLYTDSTALEALALQRGITTYFEEDIYTLSSRVVGDRNVFVITNYKNKTSPLCIDMMDEAVCVIQY